MCPRSTQTIHSQTPPGPRRIRVRYVLVLAAVCLLTGLLPVLAQQWPQYQRFSTHPGTMPDSADSAFSLPGHNAPAVVPNGAKAKWIIDTRTNGRWGSARSSVSVTTNIGTATLTTDFNAGNTLSLSATDAAKIKVGDLLSVDEFPANTVWQAGVACDTQRARFVRPTARNGFYYECTTAGVTGATEPAWPIVPGATIADNTATWTCRAGGEDLGAVTAIVGTTVTVTNAPTVPHVTGSKVFITPVVTLQNALVADGVDDDMLTLAPGSIDRVHVGDILIVGIDPPSQVWQASTTYAAGARVRPISHTGFYFVCTGAGASGINEPAWPTTAGATVTDGGVTWTCHTGSEYLGPILSVNRTTRVVRVTHPSLIDHLVTEPVQVSLYRKDSLVAGAVVDYADQSLTVNVPDVAPPTKPNWLQSDPWYDTGFASQSNPSNTIVTFFSRITPRFTDDAGKLLETFDAGAGHNQEIRVGFREDDPAVKNPLDNKQDSPIYVYLYLTDTGKVGIRRIAKTALAETDAKSPAEVSLPNAATYNLASGIQLALCITPTGPNAAIATGYYREVDAKGQFPAGFSGFTAFASYVLPSTLTSTLPAPYADANLPVSVYPYLQGFDIGDPTSLFALHASELTLYKSNPFAGGALGTGATAMQVNHPERFQIGDLIDIIDPFDPAIHDTARIYSIQNSTIYFFTNRPSGVLANTYPTDAIVRAGQPGQPTAYVGAEDGALRAANPEVMETYGSANQPMQHWRQTGYNYLGAIEGPPAVDATLGRVYVTSLSGRLFAFAENGQFLWAYPALDQAALAPMKVPPVLDEQGNIYIAADGGGRFIQNNKYVYPSSQILKITPDGTPALDNTGTPIVYSPSGLTADESAQIVGMALYRTTPANDNTLRLLFSARVKDTNTNAVSGRVYSLDSALKETWGGSAQPYYPTGPLSTGPVVGVYKDLATVEHYTIYIGDENGVIHAFYEVGNMVQSRWVTDVAAMTPYTVPTTANAPVTMTAAVSDDGNSLFVADKTGNLYAIVSSGPDTVKTDLIPQANLKVKFAATRAAVTDPLEPVSGPLTLDASGRLLVSTEMGSVYCFDTATFDPVAFVPPLWKWNTSANAGMSQALAIRTAPALWTAGVEPMVMVGCDDGQVYAISQTGARAPSGTSVAVADGFWPFFHRDERRTGSLAQLSLLDAGPLQPSLRWFQEHPLGLSSSPLVSDRTPGGNAWVLQGTENGRLYAYNASTGVLINSLDWNQTFSPIANEQKESDGYVQLFGEGPIRGTPALHSDASAGWGLNGMIAVPTMGGSLHVVTANGHEEKSTRGMLAAPHKLLGNFQASPVISKDGTIYAVTVDDLDITGAYHLNGGVTNDAALRDADDSSGVGPLNANDKLTYDLNALTFVTRVRVRTQNKGTLNIYNNDQVIFSQSYDATAKPHYHHMDVALQATKVEWVNNDANGQVYALEVYSSGAIKQLASATVGGGDPATPHLHYTADGTPVNASALTGVELRAAVHLPGKVLGALDNKIFAYYTVLSFANDHAPAPINSLTGTLSATGADGRVYPIQTLTTVAGGQYVIPINRYITGLTWKATGVSKLAAIAVYQRDFSKGNTGSTVYAFKPDFTTADPHLTFLWKYPKDADGYLAPVESSPAVAEGATQVNDTIFVATTGGEVLALNGNGDPIWTKPTDVYNPISASPTLVHDATGANTYVQVADEGGDLHLLNASDGNTRNGWPVVHLDESFTTSAAITAEHQAYQVSNMGRVYKVNVKNDDPVYNPAPLTAPGEWKQALPTYSPHDYLLALTARVTPTFSATDQQVLLGFRHDADVPYANVYLSNTATGLQLGVTIPGAPVITPITLPAATDLTKGIELAITAQPDNISARIRGYYRLPDAGGNFTGPYTELGGDVAASNLFDLYPYVQAIGSAFPVTAANVTFYPLAQFKANLNTAVNSSPVIDATGRLFLGADNGLLYALEPDTTNLPGTMAVSWSYSPWRATIFSTLAQSITGGTRTFQVTSVLGFSIGDPLEITQPDGSNPEYIGTVTGITPAPDAVQTTTTQTVPGANPRELPVVSTAGMAVGDDVNILPPADPLALPQFVRFVGKITKIDPTKITLDRDIQTIDLTGDGTANDLYPANTSVFSGHTVGYLSVSLGPGSFRNSGDIVRIRRHPTMPMRTSPSIGPSQTLYIGGTDGILYAIGAIGPSGTPGPLPPVRDTINDDIWPTFHHDNQRLGFANRMGVRQPGFIYDSTTKQYTIGTRWITEASGKLYSSPALGYSDNGNTAGVLYLGTATQPLASGTVQQGGSLLAMDANLGGILWQFDDNQRMGQVFSSPAVVDIYRSDNMDVTSREELAIFGSQDIERPISAALTGAVVLDLNGNEVRLGLGEPSPTDGINTIAAGGRTTPPTPAPPDRVVALIVDQNVFSPGMQVFLTDSGTGAGYEVFGNVLKVTQDGVGRWLVRLTSSHVATQTHLFANSVAHSILTQQGHMYAVDRNGTMKWKFPANDTDEPISMIFASPVISAHIVKPADLTGTNVYFATRNGMVFALDLDGHELWHHFISLPAAETGQMDVISSPTLDANGAHLYIGVQIVGSPTGYVVALDTSTEDLDQRQLWVRAVDGAVTGSPVLATDDALGERLYVGTDSGDHGKMYCINTANGADVIPPLVNFPDDPTKAAGAVSPLGPIFGTPAMVPATSQLRFGKPTVDTGDNHKLILGAAGSTTGLLAGMRVRLRWGGGTREWRIKLVDTDRITLYDPADATDPTIPVHPYDSVVTNEQMLVVGARNQMLYLLSEKFEPMGIVPTGGAIIASPALSAETDLVASGIHSYTAYIGSDDHLFRALTLLPIIPDPANAIGINPPNQPIFERWRANLYQPIESSPVLGIPAVDTNHQSLLFQAGGDDRVYCFPGDRVINPPKPKYKVRSTLEVRKTVVNTGKIDPQTGLASNYTWWKFTVTARNTGESPIDHIKIYDNLPASICAPPVAPDITPPSPLFTGLKADEWSAVNNRGSVSDPQWELHWSDNVLGAEGTGFTLNPYDKSTTQPQSDYMRVFTFYAAIKDTARNYAALGTKFKVLGDPSVMASGNEIKPNPPAPVVRKIGDTVYLQFYNHPIPLDTGTAEGQNEIYASGQTVEGYTDNLQTVNIEAHTETPVRNDWVGSDRSYIVRLYYNGHKDPASGKLLDALTGETRAFSPWNQTDPDTGQPLTFKVSTQPRPNGRVEARGTQMVSFKIPELGIATSGIRLQLFPNAKRYDRLAQPASAVDSSVTPYAWRLSIQQGKSQLGDKIEWGNELFYEERVLLAHVTQNSGGTAITVDDASRIKPHHILLIGSSAEVYVISVVGNVITVSAPAAVSAGQEVRDEWSPDMVITNPVSVGGVANDRLTLGNMSTPGNTATAGPIAVTNDSTNWGVNPSFPQYRFMLASPDLRVPSAGMYDYNKLLNSVSPFGVPSRTWENWVDVHYDPYLESHITMGPDILDLPNGSALRGMEALKMRMARDVPNSQGASLNVNDPNPDYNMYMSMQEEGLSPIPLFDAANNCWYMDFNKNGVYDAGIDPRHDDKNGTNVIDAGDSWFLDFDLDGKPTDKVEPVLNDINGNGRIDPGENFIFNVPGKPVLSLGKHGMQIYIDMNGNGVYDAGEPLYQYNAIAPTSRDFAAWDAFTDMNANWPSELLAGMGVGPKTHVEMPAPVIDFGRASLFSTMSNPQASPELRNAGNLTLFGQKLAATSSLAVANGGAVQELPLDNFLLNTGLAGVKYSTATGVTLRDIRDSQPFFFNPYLFAGWMIPKNPVGEDRQLGRPMDLQLPGTDFRQPTNTYIGDAKVSVVDGLNRTDIASSLISVRVHESDLSQVIPAPYPQTPASIDYSQPNASANTLNWTTALAGAASWPTEMVLTKRNAINAGEPDMPAVVVASNTPLLPAVFNRSAPDYTLLMPTNNTDTNLWYRRVKHQLTVPVQNIPDGTTAIYVTKAVYDQVRATDGTNVDTFTSDFVILRRKPTSVEPNLPEFYGRVVSKVDVGNNKDYYLQVDTAIRVNPNLPVDPTTYLSMDDTVVEILSHPWIPLFQQTDIDQVRGAFDDPGNPGNAVRPIHCTQPSFTLDKNGDPWLAFTVSAVRRVTINGQVNNLPVSYLIYKPFNPDKPLANAAQWIGAPNMPVDNNNPTAYPDRQHPTLLPDVSGVGGLTFYDLGVEGTRQLVYAVTVPTLATPVWQMDNSLDAINWSLGSVSSPQVWADSNAAGSGPESPMTRANLIFQALGEDGNIDLYYARVQVNATAPLLTVQPLSLPDADPATGKVKEDFTSAGNGLFTGGKYLGWAKDSVLTINGTDHPLDMITDLQHEYVLEFTDGVNNQVKLSIDPYRGLVRVQRGQVTSVTLTGKPRLQRLTTHLSPDVNPMVSIERWRYLNADNSLNFGADGTDIQGSDGSLKARPRVWLFWTRHHEDGLGSRVYYRTLRMSKGATDTEYTRLDGEIRGKGFTDADPSKPELANNTWNVDMPERMLPMQMPVSDGSLFITRQSASNNSPQAGLWVLSTATRASSPPYLGTAMTNMYQTTQHDLFMQVINVPVPDNYKK